MSASGESSTTMHRLLHTSGSHPIPPPDDPKDTASRGITTIVTPKSQFRTYPSNQVADAPRVKKTPVKKAVSQKSPAAVDVEVAPVVKKKIITKGKPVVIAQEAVPLQIIEGTAAVPVEQPPVPKRKIQKRKMRLVLEAEDEIVDDQPAAEVATGMQEPVIENEQAVTEPTVATVLVEPVVEKSPVVEPAVATMVNEGPSTTDDVDDIIQQVLTETAQLEPTDEGDPVDEPDVSGAHVEDQPAGPAAEKQWFDLPYEDIMAQMDADRPVVSPSDTDEYVEEPEDVEISDDEHSVDTVYIPGVDEGDWYKASLPKIHPEEKGKEPLQLKDPAKGKPPQENYSLICADIDLLVHLREQSARQDGQNHSDLHLLHLNEFKKSVLAHNVTVIADFMDVKKAVRELNAKVDAVSTRLDDVRQDIEATKEAISHQLLDFQAQAQANHNILTGQLSELVNYINRGGNDKKGEGSSRGPQPPPDDQNRGSGNTGGGGDTDRSFVERLLTADRQRQREISRGHSSGSYKRRRY
ncbi:hypothetical protein F511_19380 [Dorcoceras hygrometricum]|uniref:Uncharacterized protein n=1 Tax=Dorcoceras hygrometricum TaxID=472368 RepID=A0A2Z7BFC0_9LAMI|nr:hypothetical protein F511_19380 [Dorcoceras hygrometricum]